MQQEVERLRAEAFDSAPGLADDIRARLFDPISTRENTIPELWKTVFQGDIRCTERSLIAPNIEPEKYKELFDAYTESLFHEIRYLLFGIKQEKNTIRWLQGQARDFQRQAWIDAKELSSCFLKKVQSLVPDLEGHDINKLLKAYVDCLLSKTMRLLAELNDKISSPATSSSANNRLLNSTTGHIVTYHTELNEASFPSLTHLVRCMSTNKAGLNPDAFHTSGLEQWFDLRMVTSYLGVSNEEMEEIIEYFWKELSKDERFRLFYDKKTKRIWIHMKPWTAV